MDVDVVVILSILAVVVAVINIYCIAVFLYKKHFHKASHLTICSLIFAHALQGVLVIPLYAIKRAEVTKDPSLCTMFRFTYMFTNYASCMSLLAISLDRCFGVTYPLKYKIFITAHRMMLFLLGAWVYIFILCCLPFLESDKKCGYIPQDEWTIGMLLGNTMVPCIAILICYFIIFGKVKKVLYNRQLNRRMTANSRALRNQWNKSKITVVIVFCYILCWGPGFVYYTLLKLCKECFYEGWNETKDEHYVTFVIKLLTFVDGIIAPLLYCLSNQTFILARNKLVRAIKLKVCPMSGDICEAYTPTLNSKHLNSDSGVIRREAKGRLGQLKSDWTHTASTNASYVNSITISPIFELNSQSHNALSSSHLKI